MITDVDIDKEVARNDSSLRICFDFTMIDEEDVCISFMQMHKL